MQHYGDQDRGIIQVSWDDVMEICKHLALEISREFDPDIVIGIAKGGVIPAAIIASILRKDFYPIRISRRKKDVVVRDRPEVSVPITGEVEGKRVLIVDEVSQTGETLRLAVREAQKLGAKKVKTATLYARRSEWKPNWFGFESDAVIIQPWDYEVLSGGKFIIHPEYEQAIAEAERE